MLFNHKPIEQITEEELRSLIGFRENENVEFKLTYNLFGEAQKENDLEKYELLKDVTSIANSGGGYILIGVRANKNSEAVKFESIEGKNLERMKQTILGLCVENIEERISGLEVKHRNVDGSTLIIVRIPASARVPHMVKFLNNTHFIKRYQDGKREMSLAEIRFAFNNDVTERRLASIEELLKRESRGNRNDSRVQDLFSDSNLNEIPDGNSVTNTVVTEFQENSAEPAFLIVAGPKHPKPDILDLSDAQLNTFLSTPGPDDRYSGWNMNIAGRQQIAKTNSKIILGHTELATICLRSNGFMSFQTALDQRFCWSQSQKEFESRPRFSSYAVVEFPVSFLRMYRALTDLVKLTDSEWCVAVCYRKPQGYYLAPGHPMNPFFDSGDAHVYQGVNDLLYADIFRGQFDADKIAHEMLEKIYSNFGLTENSIPFYVDEQNRFDIL